MATWTFDVLALFTGIFVGGLFGACVANWIAYDKTRYQMEFYKGYSEAMQEIDIRRARFAGQDRQREEEENGKQF